MHPIVRLLRPEQWLKNGFVWIGYLFSELPHGASILPEVILLTVAFCILSSSVYIVNDLKDIEQDRLHEKKSKRPLASGEITPSAATILAVFLGAAALTIAYSVSLTAFFILIAYLLLNLAYTFKLKRIVLLDVFCISLGFMLRILAGTLGVDIPPSKWLLLCGMLVTLFLGFAKRRAELIQMQKKSESTRPVLLNYSVELLDQYIAITLACTILSYSLYTMSAETVQLHHGSQIIYTVPIVIYALFRYTYLLYQGRKGDDTSRELVRDPHLIICILSWMAIVAWITGKLPI